MSMFNKALHYILMYWNRKINVFLLTDLIQKVPGSNVNFKIWIALSYSCLFSPWSLSQINFYNTVSPFCCGGCYLTRVLFASSERYFDMKKNQCKEGLDIYKKFLARMTKLSEFLKVAEVNKSTSMEGITFSCLYWCSGLYS